jgi:hypothetical protein
VWLQNYYQEAEEGSCWNNNVSIKPKKEIGGITKSQPFFLCYDHFGPVFILLH